MAHLPLNYRLFSNYSKIILASCKYRTEANIENPTLRYPFVIKIHANSINTVSDKSSTKNTVTILYRKLLFAKEEFIQNYATAGLQLNGIASRDGKVI